MTKDRGLPVGVATWPLGYVLTAQLGNEGWSLGSGSHRHEAVLRRPCRRWKCTRQEGPAWPAGRGTRANSKRGVGGNQTEARVPGPGGRPASAAPVSPTDGHLGLLRHCEEHLETSL